MQELGVQPSERTKMLYAHIRADKPDPLSVHLPVPRSPAHTPPLGREQLTGLMVYFKQLQAQLVDLEEQLKRDIRAVEVVLSDRQ
ncbi:MAG: hypothetical protein M3495_06705 [Pseudomonadota bacterium]|nr:hypothetical protein [Pseudomonadota bacterium]